MKYTPFKKNNIAEIREDNNYIIKKKDNIQIIKYDKKNLTLDNESSVGLFRSVVMNDKNVVAFAPQKSVNYNNFIVENEFEDCYITEYIGR